MDRCDQIDRPFRSSETGCFACNTATAVAIEMLRAKYNVPFVGVEPDLNFLKRNNMTDGQKVGVLTTPVTPKMEKFQKLKAKRDPEGSFDYLVMPTLAHLVEKLFYASSEARTGIMEDIKNELDHQIKNKYDYLVLGCTHYGLIDQLIQTHLGITTICPSAIAGRVDLVGQKWDNLTEKVLFCSSKKKALNLKM